jgi:hypothetical protein
VRCTSRGPILDSKSSYVIADFGICQCRFGVRLRTTIITLLSSRQLKAPSIMPTFITLTNCPICDRTGEELVGQVQTFVRRWNQVITSHFSFCSACEFAWMRNPPSAESLADYYSSNDQYRRSELTAEEAHHIGEQVCFLVSGAERSVARHLEIGPDNGAFLDLLALRLRGESFFLELNEEAASALTARGMRDAGSLPDVRFDTITLRHVLEHIVDPVAFLNSTSERLNDRGVVFIEVPDYSSVADGESDVFQLEHVNYFSITSIQQVARRCGLRVERVEFARTAGYSTTPNRVLRALLRRTRHRHDGNSVEAWKLLLHDSDVSIRKLGEKLSSSAGRGLAIYGAGTLTMKLIAAAPKGVLLKHIFDVDRRKHGWSLLGTTVQPPEAIDHRDFDLIILTVVGYEAEVRRLLREKGVPDDKIVTIQEFIGDGEE